MQTPTPMRQTFDKTEHLKRQNAIDALFATRNKFLVYPLRVTYTLVARQPDMPPAQAMVIVRKRQFKHAVDRNRYKRLLREAYRLHKQPLLEALRGTPNSMHIALWGISDTLPDFRTVEQQMVVAIDRLTAAVR